MTGANAVPVIPSMRLDGRRALVSGGSSGLGMACAAVLAAAGAEVTILARDRERLEESVAALRASGGKANALTMDVTNVESIEHELATLETHDILVNSAGTNRPGPFVDVTPDDYDAVFDINVRGAFFLTRAFAGRLIGANRPGCVINISSQMGHVGAAQRSIYCASKHAVEGLTKALAVELAPHGIRVNSICPTFIETPMTAPFLADEAFRARTLAKIKLGRLGRPEDIMGAVLLLASEAGALMTGSSLLIDGGWTAD